MPAEEPRAPIAFLVAGSEMVSFTLFGLLLDYLLGTRPGFTIALTLLGVVAAFFQLSQLAKAFAKKPQNDAPKPDGNDPRGTDRDSTPRGD